MLDAINQRLFDLYARSGSDLRLYALIEGTQAHTLVGHYPNHDAGAIALFDRALHSALADAGPWLLKIDQTAAANLSLLDALSAASPGVIWLVSTRPLDQLQADLTARLEVKLPDGTITLLRYYDPAVLRDLAQTLQATPRVEFFAPAQEWLVYQDGTLSVVFSMDTPAAKDDLPPHETLPT